MSDSGYLIRTVLCVILLHSFIYSFKDSVSINLVILPLHRNTSRRAAIDRHSRFPIKYRLKNIKIHLVVEDKTLTIKLVPNAI